MAMNRGWKLISIVLDRINENSMRIILLFIASLLLNSVYIVSAYAETTQLRIEKTRDSEDPLDPEVVSIGAFSISRDKVGHFDLIQFESDELVGEGKIQGIDFGIGYTYSEGRSPLTMYLGFGFLLGYDKGLSDFVPGYYPEVGLVFMVQEGVGVTATAKRYFNVFDDYKDIITVGLVLAY